MPATPPDDPPAVPPQRERLTLNDVARALSVSRTTVSNAFNRPEQLSETLRETILARSRELGYFGPHPMARALRRRELREVGVVFHHDLSYAMSDPASLEFLRGVAHELDKRALTLQVIPKMGRKLMLEAAFQTTADILIVHAEIGAEFVPEVVSARKPLVLVDAHVDGVPSVRTQDRQGAMLAMRHALACRPDRVIVLCFLVTEEERARVLAHRRAPRSGYVGSERMAGYAAAAREAGFPLEQIVWLDIDDQFPESAAERVAELRDGLPARARIAVVAMSDRIALAAQRTLKKWRGIELGALVGFDDIPAAAEAGLTTVRLDPYGKGRLAVQVVLDGAKPAVLPVELVVRKT